VPSGREPASSDLLGRKTAESIGRALPNRLNLILSLSRQLPFTGENVVAVHSLEQAITQAGSSDLMVVGGGEIYRQTLGIASRLYLTRVDAEVRQACLLAARHLELEFGCVVEAVDPSIEDLQQTFEALVALDTDREGLRTLGDKRGVAFSGPLGRLLARVVVLTEGDARFLTPFLELIKDSVLSPSRDIPAHSPRRPAAARRS
jgi:hypothetical protein